MNSPPNSAVPPDRRGLRQRLIDQRLALPAAEHARLSAAIEAALRIGLGADLTGRVVGFCWPWRGEFDMRPLMALAHARGALACLPAAVMPHQPMRYHHWWPQAPMQVDRHGIACPADGAELVPQLALVPVNGFDARGFRLGYGGGYFDRTLAAIRPRPIAVGVGFELARLATIHPGAHDLPMDCVVTEAGLFVRSADDDLLHPVTPREGSLWQASRRPAV